MNRTSRHAKRRVQWFKYWWSPEGARYLRRKNRRRPRLTAASRAVRAEVRKEERLGRAAARNPHYAPAIIRDYLAVGAILDRKYGMMWPARLEA